MIFEAKYKTIHGEGIKMLTLKQMLQKLPIALAQVKAGNTSKSLQNKIRQIVYSLYPAKEITKNVYNNIMNSINVKYKMDTIFMNSGNSKTSDSHRLLLNPSDKIGLRKIDIYVTLSILNIYYTWKNIKKSCKKNTYKYLDQRVKKNLNYMMNHVLD